MAREKQTQDNNVMCYRRGKSEKSTKKSLCDPTSRIDPLVNQLEYNDNK